MSTRDLIPYTTDGKPERNSVDTNLALLRSDIAYIKNDVQEIKGKMEVNYVTREEFIPMRNTVYGFISLIVVGFMGAIISLVYKSHL